MTDEQLPTRRSLRLKREAEQREQKLNQIASGNSPQGDDPAVRPNATAPQPSAQGNAPQHGGEWAPEQPGGASPAAAAEPSAPASAATSTGGVRRTSAFSTGSASVEPPSPAAFPASAIPTPAATAASSSAAPSASSPSSVFPAAPAPASEPPAKPAGEPALTLEPEDEPETAAATGTAAAASEPTSPFAPDGAVNAAQDSSIPDELPASFAPARDEDVTTSSPATVAALNLDEDDEDRSVDAGHARVRRSHRALKVVALSVAALFVFSGAAVGAIYQRLSGNLTYVNTGDLVDNTDPASTFEPPSDPSDGKALNYLLIGVDDRSGDNGEFTNDNPGGSRSDTTMVLHISENRKRIEVVSIPRDSMVPIPSCKLTGGGSTSATFGMFNAAYAMGYDQGGDTASAISCVWRTVQENTGVKIDGAIMVDFAGFANVVDAIDGVYMCIPEETISKDAGKLHLKAGWQTLNGKDALNYARARKGTGQNFDGSDLNRAGRQQQMVAAIFNQITEDGILSNPTRLYSFADAVTKTLTVTETLSSTKDLVGLAYSLRNVKSKNVTLMTVPFEAYPADRNRIQWSSAAADVWKNMSKDKPIVESESSSSSKSSSSTSTTSKKATTDEAEATKTPGREAFTAEDTTAVCDAPAKKN